MLQNLLKIAYNKILKESLLICACTRGDIHGRGLVVRAEEKCDGAVVSKNQGMEWWLRGRAPDCRLRGQWFNPTYRRFKTQAISFTSHCVYLSEETLKAGGPCNLLSMPG